MKKKFTILITAAFMLLTMMARPVTVWGQTRDTQTVSYGWETTDDATPWTISNTIVATSGEGNTGSYAGKINTNSTTVQFNEKVYVTSFSYAFKRTSTNNNYSVYIETSTDGSNWSIKDTQAMNTFTNGSYRTVTKEFDGSQELYVRFRCNNTTAVRYVDDVTITYATSAAQLDPCDLTLTNASTSIVFDLYNNSDPYVINYTTSSTGEVTVADSEYITTEVDQTNKTITVTPVAVTNGAKVITVNQAADDNYTAGSKTFTINITDSTPFTGGDVTFDATIDKGTSPLVKNGVTFACTNGVLNNGSEYRLYKNSTTTFSVTQGFITQIVFTGVSGNPASGFASQTGWTTSGNNGTWTGEATEVSFTASGAQVRATQIIVTVESSSDPAVHTTTTINVPINFNTDIQQGTNAGTLTATVTVTSDGSEVSGATVTWESSNTAAATIDENGVVTLIAAGTTTITASYAGVENQYKPSSATYELTVIDSNAPGTENNPYTVAQAIAATPASGTTGNVYIHGVVSAFWNNNTTILGDNSHRYYISDDGGTTTQLLVYNGKGLNNVAFSNADDLLIGDEITLVGKLKTFSNEPEVDANNYIVSLVRPTVAVEAPTFSPTAGTYATAQTVTISCETNGATIYYTTNGTTPTNESTEYPGGLNVTTTTTFKAIAIKGSDASAVTTATYHINSQTNPYTVAQALVFYEYPANGIYVHGIVSTAPTQGPTNNGELTYYISDDGTTASQLEVYKGKGLDNAAFEAQDDIQVGDIVTIYGNVQVYNNTIEFGSGNYLVEFERPVEPTISANNVNIEYSDVEGVIAYEINNPVEGGVLTAATEAEWIYLDENTASPIAFICEINTETTARSVTVTLTYTYNTDQTVTKDVTVTQGAAPSPAITVAQTSIDVDYNNHDGTLNVEYTMINLTNALTVFLCTSEGASTSYDWFEAEINSNNNVYYVINKNEGEARTAYFKVKGKDFNNNDVYSELVTVSQAAPVVPPTPGTEQWVLTPLADLTSSDVFVIVGDNGSTYAMSNDNGTSSAPAAVEVTVSNDALSEEPAENLKWNLTIADGTYTFYPNGDTEKWLYCTNTNNGVRVGTNDNKTFTISEGYLFHSGTSRYVGIYNSQDWRCYTSITGSSNIKDQTFAFYKYVENPTAPKITLSSYEIEATAEGEEGTLTVTYENITDVAAEVYFCDAEGEAASYDWITAEINDDTNVEYLIEGNEGAARTAYFKVYALDDNAEDVYSNLVTVTQAGAPIPTYTVSFNVGEGTFVPNEFFGNDTVEVEAGTYTLPSATKVGYSFSGWSDSEQIYAAGESYTVSDNVEFTATYTVLQHFTIQFYVNNNHTQEEDMDAIQDTPTRLPLISSLTPDGFEITGWSELPLSTVAVPNPYTPENDVVLYAILNYLYSEDSYELVTNASDLHEGDIVVIAALNSDYAISTTQNTNNRSQAAIAKSGNKIALSDGVCEFVLGNGSVENSWSFYDTVNNGDNKGYIYAASSEKNWLKTQQELTANSSWTININKNTATITAQGSNTHNVLQYNSSNRIFSCYTSTTQQPVCLYKKNAAPSFNYVNTITDPEAQMDDDISETTCVVVADNVVLTFNGENNGTAANLIIEDGAQLIHDNEGVQATVRKKIKGFGDNKAGNYYFLVSPLVDDINPAIVTNMTPNGEGEDFDLYEWNSGEDEEWRNYKVTPFSLVNTTGYLYANKNNVTLNFEGTLLKSDAVVEIELNYEEDDDFGNWNLVGNPFTCNANVSLIDNGAATSMAYYRMNSDGTEFESSTDPITPMEGIFVQTTGDGQKCWFSRIDPEQSAGKGNLNLQVAQVTNSRDAQPATDNAIIRFDGGNALEKFSFRDDNAKLYIPQNGKDYAVVSAEAQGEMPVYFKAAENGTYTIDFSMDNVEFSYLHLIDNKTGNDVDLLQTSSYTFEANTIDYASRFRLVFKAIGNENDSENNDFGFFDANGNLLILGIEGTATLQVMDVTGRTISSETFSGDYSKAINASAGVYMLRLVQGNDVRTQKIVVK